MALTHSLRLFETKVLDKVNGSCSKRIAYLRLSFGILRYFTVIMRQLVAILFADMTGYTALMQENEQLARSKRQRLKEVLEAAVENSNGKILQYYGDGSLSIFSSAIDGVYAAISIQQQLQQEPKVDLRIGIHTGDVIMEEEAIYGAGSGRRHMPLYSMPVN